MWWRTTLCFRKIDEKWMLTHSHDSVPFNMETGKASLNLEP
jgi:ketosteroid isomerase-like protein